MSGARLCSAFTLSSVSLATFVITNQLGLSECHVQCRGAKHVYSKAEIRTLDALLDLMIATLALAASEEEWQF